MQFVFPSYAKQFVFFFYLWFWLSNNRVNASQLINIQSLTNSKNEEIALSQLIEVHDLFHDKNTNSMSLFSLFSLPKKPAFEQIQDLTNSFNDRSRQLSQIIEDACSSLIGASYDLQLFAFFKETSDKITRDTLWEYLSVSKPSFEVMLPSSNRALQQQTFNQAKYFCAYGYHLQVSFNDTTKTLEIIGNKDYYFWMADQLNELIEHIDSISPASDYLLSLQQRLIILKKLTEKYSDAVLYTTYTKLEKIVYVPSLHTLDNLKVYLESELQEIARLVEQLNQVFPLKIEQLEYDQAISLANAAINSFMQDIAEEDTDVTQRLHQREAERRSIEIIGNWNATQTLWTAWKDVTAQSVGFVLRSVGHVSSTVITGIANGLLIKPVFDVLYAILRCIVSHPVGCVLLLVMISWFLAPFTFIAKMVWAPISFILSKFNNKKTI